MYAEHFSNREADSFEAVQGALGDIGVDQILSPTIRGDIAILRCFVGAHQLALDGELFADISAASASDPNIWSNFVAILRISRLPRNRINALLGRIYVAIGVNHSEADGVMKEIRDALQKRTSDLDSHATWDRMALPLPYPKQPLQAKIEGGIPASPVRIESLELRDIGGIKNISIDLKPPVDGAGQWVVIIGPNGVGKTTILRSLVLALRSVKHPSIWPKGAFGGTWQRIPRVGETEVINSKIVVTLGDGTEHSTLIRPSTGISITQLPEQEHPRLIPIFAYGCRRGSALGGAARQVNLNDDDGPEIATLFDEGADLIQAETWLIALEGDTSRSAVSKTIYESIISALKILMDLESIQVLDQQLWATEFGSTRIPFGCLSDGYLTNAGWFLDLIARWIKLAERNNFEITKDFLLQMRGLVLIDEIDLHLHPSWQKEIIRRTRALLPEMSFVVTTHNPLTLVGAKADEIWVLEKLADETQITSGIETPMLLTGGQIYRQYFGISDIYPDELGRALQRYSYLSGHALRDDDEQAELENIQHQLSEAGINPGWEVTPRSVVEPSAPIKAKLKKQK